MSQQELPLHKRLIELFKAAAEEFGADMAVRFGAALSFYTLFSLVPLLFLVVAVVGFVSTEPVTDVVADETAATCDGVTVDTLGLSPENAIARVLGQVEEFAGAQVADQLAELTCQAVANRQQALWIGVALALFSGSSVFLHVQGILNHIFDVPEEKTQGITNMLVQRGIAVGWALLLAVLVFVPIVAVATVNFLRGLLPPDLDWLSPVLSIGVPLASVAMLMVVTALTLQVLTRAKVPWQAARRGGMFTAVAGLAGAFLVGTYLGQFGAGGALGALGGVAILLFFFNLMWIIYLFGAELTRVYADYLTYGDIQAPSARAVAAGVPSPPVGQKTAAFVEGPPRQASRSWEGLSAFVIGLVAGWVARRRR